MDGKRKVVQRQSVLKFTSRWELVEILEGIYPNHWKKQEFPANTGYLGVSI